MSYSRVNSIHSSVRSVSSVDNKTIVFNKVTGSPFKDAQPEPVKIEACGDVKEDDDDDEMEKEQMFVEPHESFEFRTMEWGGPRRGGRLPEPTRYGDWERKGRATDF
ncbi:hypothetical protein FisN_17Hh111 [Fistulifera solaris]|uniref:Succinate dehydrogenase assembly factor 4, mitochondrial n=1 Tax=Fistulifera solaris TaxID=1519565 RepID=A0A1Z5JHD7_FISSO|nr:hypothetical protein FisN_17Hh111 [Fistulifera solaris]|eukprot:GAX13181.1 hypothetical protein FisN_17Hh111 [Fistulifera solaris]